MSTNTLVKKLNKIPKSTIITGIVGVGGIFITKRYGDNKLEKFIKDSVKMSKAFRHVNNTEIKSKFFK